MDAKDCFDVQCEICERFTDDAKVCDFCGKVFCPSCIKNGICVACNRAEELRKQRHLEMCEKMKNG